MGDGTQRSRAGLSSVGPPGLRPRLWRARGCRGASGSDLVLLFECSIPIPIPIRTRAARVCREGSSSAGGVSGWDVGNGHDGHLGGFEALRLIRFVFRGVVARCRGDRMLAFRGKGSVAPPGAGCSWGTEPSAHALGYRLSALRAWSRGLECRFGAARKVKEPGRVPLPHASVSVSASASESKTKGSIGIDPDPEADDLDAASFGMGIAG
jgi:hypothetical protein